MEKCDDCKHFDEIEKIPYIGICNEVYSKYYCLLILLSKPICEYFEQKINKNIK